MNYNNKDNKVTILGESSVGKSSIVVRLINNSFHENNESTIGASYYSYKNNGVRLDLWDTSGQEKYRSISSLYYRDAIVIIIVFDVTSMKSFKEIAYWIKEIKHNIHNEYKLYIVGNKIDLIYEDVSKLIFNNIYDDIYYVSAKQNIGINELFEDITEYVKKLNIKEKENIIKLSKQSQNMDDEFENKCYSNYC